MNLFIKIVSCFYFLFASLSVSADSTVPATDTKIYWMKIKASGQFERSAIANIGASIEYVDSEYVVAIGNGEEKAELESSGRILVSFEIKESMLRDFPSHDTKFHNYTEMTDELNKLVAQYPNEVELTSIGKTHEGRNIWSLRITRDASKNKGNRPAAIFMGGHHAREHLSIEVPLLLAQHLLKQAQTSGSKEDGLLSSREIHIIPVVNPDGAEYDIVDSNYKLWRKNRRANGNNVYGVDLNRNYGYGWGTGGSSNKPNSDTYMGPAPFSEPETQAIKNYIESFQNINVLLSYHTFSELILYPWGGESSPIADQRDFQVHKKLAETMAGWNGYQPMQAADLYVASGDTVDWAFGEQGIIGFTFELDPKNTFATMFDPTLGFYPGQSIIQNVFNKNLQPALYLMDLADNPYRALGTSSQALGLTSPLF